MMKKWILPACLISVGLAAFVFGYIHTNSTIPRQKAEQIATDYIQKKYPDYYNEYKAKYRVEIANLNLDLFSDILGTQKWAVYTVFPQGIITVNAYTGEVEKDYIGFFEWVAQSKNTLLPGDFLPIALYILAIALACLYSKNVTIKVLFYVCVALLLLSFPISYVMDAAYILFFGS